MAEVVAWPSQPSAQRAAAERGAGVLRAGGLVVYPTDTVYGLGADAAIDAAIQRIYGVKGRPDEKAIIWLVTSLDEVRTACEVDGRAEQLAARFWPGALTLILRRRHPAPGSLATLGVRVPAHPTALALIGALGRAVATTSANRSGQPSARTAEEAQQQIGSGVDLILDAGPTPGGVESTIIDLSTATPTVLRAGALAAAEIEAVLGVPVRPPAT